MQAGEVIYLLFQAKSQSWKEFGGNCLNQLLQGSINRQTRKDITFVVLGGA
jgi:hypothetical protein